ncbi:MAG: DUF3795 domain-containing protein [Candidatus Thorarchaeota archaeon]
MQAYCGLICTDCEAYIAKRTNDDNLRKKTAKLWTGPTWSVKPGEVNCDGCKSSSGTLFKHCINCAVRACAIEKGVDTCAHCDSYPCTPLEAMLDIIGDEAKTNLLQIRQTL